MRLSWSLAEFSTWKITGFMWARQNNTMFEVFVVGSTSVQILITSGWPKSNECHIYSFWRRFFCFVLGLNLHAQHMNTLNTAFSQHHSRLIKQSLLQFYTGSYEAKEIGLSYRTSMYYLWSMGTICIDLWRTPGCLQWEVLKAQQKL